MLNLDESEGAAMWRVGRIAAGIVCMLSMGWGVYTYMTGEFPFEPILTFIGSFVGWAFTEYKSDANARNASPTLHPHDVDLALKLRGLLNESMKRYLRDHSFGESFRYDRIEPLRELGGWTGPEYEFENGELDNVAAELVQKSEELNQKIGEYGNPLRHRDEYWSLAPERERTLDWHSKETTLKIAEVNKLADEIADLSDKFEKMFRKLSPESYRRTETPDVSTSGPKVL